MGIKCPKCQSNNPDTQQYCGECGTQLIPSEEVSPTKTLEIPAKGLTKGTTFASRYEVIEELGKGGMGRVYKALDKEINEEVAIKLLKPEIASDESTVERFRNELKFARKIAHKNICKMYHLAKEEETPYITMEYVSGEDLKSLVRRKGKLAEEEVLSIAKQVCEGLVEAHRLGVVHRDLKPSNIMIDKEGDAKIMDFGIARSVEAPGVTQTGVMIGTPDYISPEQAEGEEADQRSDIYALGVILYEMVTGRVPFKGDTALSVALKHKSKLPPDPKELNPDVSEELRKMILICMEKERERRYQIAAELLMDLNNIEEGIPLGERKVPARKKRLPKAKRKIKWKSILLYAGVPLLLILLVVGAIYLFTGRAEAIDSIAVLPFENLTGDTEKEFFVDVATEELIGQLGQISGLRRVISRTSAMKYKETDKTLSEIARELNVDVVVEGSVQQAGDRVRIQVRLIDALPEEQNLWGQTYERAMSDILVMYGEMARAIAEKAQINLTADELMRLTSASQVNPESYDAYLKGLSHHDKGTLEGLKIALQYYELALEIDPNNALALVGISGVWAFRYQAGMVPRQEAMPLITTPIEKALELDNTLADAHAALAAHRCWREWDWESAEKEFQQALRLNPNLVGAHAGYSHLLCYMGRAEEALPHMELALELDPLSPGSYHWYGMVLNYHSRYDDAIAAFRTALDIEPNYMFSLGPLALTLGAKGKHDEELAIYRKIYADDAELTMALEDGFEKADYKGAYRAVADLMAERYGKPGKSVSAQDIGGWYQGAGDYDLAIDWFEKAYENHNPNLPYISGPYLDPLRSNPRFQELLRKMNLPVDEKE